MPFCTKESRKKKKGNCFDIDKNWADELTPSDKGSYYMHHKFEEVVLGNCVVVILENI